MVKLLSFVLILSCLNTYGQQDVPLAGTLLERSAKQRSHALIVGIGCAAASAVMYAVGDDTGKTVGPIVLGAGCLVSVGITIGSINNQARAGRALRGDPMMR